MLIRMYMYVFWHRYRELQQKLNQLEQNTMQRDRNETLLKQKEKECIQVRVQTLLSVSHVSQTLV